MGDLWQPASYNRHNAPQKSWQLEILDRLDGLAPERILDVGCGPGHLVHRLCDRFPAAREIIGLDLSSHMIEGAREAAPERATFVCRDFLQTSPADIGTFDLVVSTAALHWIADQPAVVANVARLLVAGGRFVADMGGKGNIEPQLAIAETLRRESPYAEHFPADWQPPWVWPSAEEYRAWLAAAGLEAEVQTERRDGFYADREEVIGWLHTTWLPYQERLPDDLRLRFATDLADRFLADGIEAHNRGLFTRLRIDARKPRPTPHVLPPLAD